MKHGFPSTFEPQCPSPDLPTNTTPKASSLRWESVPKSSLLDLLDIFNLLVHKLAWMDELWSPCAIDYEQPSILTSPPHALLAWENFLNSWPSPLPVTTIRANHRTIMTKRILIYFFLFQASRVAHREPVLFFHLCDDRDKWTFHIGIILWVYEAAVHKTDIHEGKKCNA